MVIALIKCLNLKCETSIDRISKIKIKERKMKGLNNEETKRPGKIESDSSLSEGPENTEPDDDEE